MGLNWDTLITELIKATPFGGFALLSIIIISQSYKGFRKDLRTTFDNSLKTVENAYRDSINESRRLIVDLSNSMSKSIK